MGKDRDNVQMCGCADVWIYSTFEHWLEGLERL